MTILTESPALLEVGLTRTSITATPANTDVAAAAAVPAGAVRALIYAATNDAIVAIEVTTASVGLRLKADVVHEIMIRAGDTIHAQSPTAGTVVHISYLKN